jgi:hypothetical protein
LKDTTLQIAAVSAIHSIKKYLERQEPELRRRFADIFG